MQAPTVSILIPTFNRAHYVGDAIASALKQDFRDIEVIVADDGSTDGTQALVASVADPRLRTVRHDLNRGIPETRNTALAAAKGAFIAWLDSDDIARATRISTQVEFLRSHPEIAMVGSAAGKLAADGTPKRGVRMPPLRPPTIQAWLLFRSAFQQSSIMGRTEILRDYQYDPTYRVCEDVDMFVRIQQHHRLANIPALLVDRRLHADQTVRTMRDDILASRQRLVLPMLGALHIDATASDIEGHVLLGLADLSDVDVDRAFLGWARAWLDRLRVANRRADVFDRDALDMASDYVWVLACRAMAPKIGRVPAMKALLSRLPKSLLGPSARAWAKDAGPVYLRR